MASSLFLRRPTYHRAVRGSRDAVGNRFTSREPKRAKPAHFGGSPTGNLEARARDLFGPPLARLDVGGSHPGDDDLVARENLGIEAMAAAAVAELRKDGLEAIAVGLGVARDREAASGECEE